MITSKYVQVFTMKLVRACFLSSWSVSLCTEERTEQQSTLWGMEYFAVTTSIQPHLPSEPGGQCNMRLSMSKARSLVFSASKLMLVGEWPANNTPSDGSRLKAWTPRFRLRQDTMVAMSNMAATTVRQRMSWLGCHNLHAAFTVSSEEAISQTS